jgi:hypothetical protein
VKAAIAVALALVPLITVASTPNPSKDALMEFFSSKGFPPKIHPRQKAVEFCWDDCEHYVLGGGIDDPRAWDVLFLHRFYYIGTGPSEEFRHAHSSLAESLMTKYERLCPRVEPLGRPGCVIGYLGQRHRIRFAHVYYDEGNRCEVWTHLVHTKTTYGSSCRKVKHAS